MSAKAKQTVTNREKYLLIVLLAAIACFALYYFFLSPQISKIFETSQSIKQLEEEAINTKAVIENVDTLRVNKESAINETKTYTNDFYYDLKSEEILYLLDGLMKKNSFTVAVFSMNAPIATGITSIETPANDKAFYPLLSDAAKLNTKIVVPRVNTAQAEPENPEEAAKYYILGSKINLTFTTTSYGSFVNFLKGIEALNKSIIISSITITKSDDSSTTIQGQLDLDFYALAKIDETEVDDLKVPKTLATGKSDLFN